MHLIETQGYRGHRLWINLERIEYVKYLDPEDHDTHGAAFVQLRGNRGDYVRLSLVGAELLDRAIYALETKHETP